MTLYNIIICLETFLMLDETTRITRDSLYLIGGKNYILFRYDKLIHRGGNIVNLVYVL